MANSKLNGPRYKYASIDTGPGSGGYWSDAVSMRNESTDALFWVRTGAGVGTITIQYKLPHTGAAWVDYVTDENLAIGERFRLDDKAAGVRWRAGIKEDTSADNTYTSGTIVTGFDW